MATAEVLMSLPSTLFGLSLDGKQKNKKRKEGPWCPSRCLSWNMFLYMSKRQKKKKKIDSVGSQLWGKVMDLADFGVLILLLTPVLTSITVSFDSL